MKCVSHLFTARHEKTLSFQLQFLRRTPRESSTQIAENLLLVPSIAIERFFWVFQEIMLLCLKSPIPPPSASRLRSSLWWAIILLSLASSQCSFCLLKWQSSKGRQGNGSAGTLGIPLGPPPFFLLTLFSAPGKNWETEKHRKMQWINFDLDSLAFELTDLTVWKFWKALSLYLAIPRLSHLLCFEFLQQRVHLTPPRAPLPLLPRCAKGQIWKNLKTIYIYLNLSTMILMPQCPMSIKCWSNGIGDRVPRRSKGLAPPTLMPTVLKPVVHCVL